MKNMNPNIGWMNMIPSEYSHFTKKSAEDRHRRKLYRECFRKWDKHIRGYLYQVGDKFYGKRCLFIRNFTVRVIDIKDSLELKHKSWIICKRHEYPSRIDYLTISICSDRQGVPCGFRLADSSREGKALRIHQTEHALMEGLTKIFCGDHPQ
ncbi:MAG: hypothetical protein WCO77_04030 [bacterium]